MVHSDIITRKNVLGGVLKPCCYAPMTGYFRDGYCRTDSNDYGKHVVCAQMTDAFLSFSKSRGNDLVTPRPEYNFPGLRAGDRWCLCALRWKEAMEHHCAPPVILESCDFSALAVVSLETLQQYAIKSAC